MNDYLIEHFEEWYIVDLLGNENFLTKSSNRNEVYSNPIIESLYKNYIQENREKLSDAIDLYFNYERYVGFIEKLNETDLIERDYFVKNKIYKDDFVEFDMANCEFKNSLLQAMFLGHLITLEFDSVDEPTDEITDDEIDKCLNEIEKEQTENSDKNSEAKELIDRLKRSVGEYVVRDGLSEFINNFTIMIDDGKVVYHYQPSNFEKELIDNFIVEYFNEEITNENRYKDFKDLVRDFYYSIPKADYEKFSSITKINLKKVIEHITDDVRKKKGGILYS